MILNILPGALLLLAAPDSTQSKPAFERRLDEASVALSEIMAAPDKGIPGDLLSKAECVVIVPGLKKAAFIFGGQYGKGFVSCRRPGGWSPPGALRIEGGSFGLQIGGSETDVVMLVMNKRGAKGLLSSQFVLGGEGSVAAGPVGRSASADTDAKMTAEILAWSRSRGVFAGLSLQGSTLSQDLDENAAIYGRRISNSEIVNSRLASPASAGKLMALLRSYSPRQR